MLALELLRAFAARDFAPAALDAVLATLPAGVATAEVATTLRFIATRIVPGLRRADDELAHVLDALEGRYVPAGPSGAPTR